MQSTNKVQTKDNQSTAKIQTKYIQNSRYKLVLPWNIAKSMTYYSQQSAFISLPIPIRFNPLLSFKLNLIAKKVKKKNVY